MIFTLSELLVGKKLMQIGGLTFANARMEEGRIHNPSPQIRPDATAGIMRPAFLLSILCQRYTIKLPTHISIAKEAPTRNGTAIAMGRGTHFPNFFGMISLNKLAATANAKNP